MNYNAKDVICPFYRNNEKKTIQCEGLISLDGIQKFGAEKALKIHMTKYCNSFNYRFCPYAKALKQKY